MTEEERSKEQLVQITLELITNTKSVAASDDVSRGIDYQEVFQTVQEIAKKERKTLERFAEDIASEILKKYGPQSVKLSLQKRPLAGLESVTITISRP